MSVEKSSDFMQGLTKYIDSCENRTDISFPPKKLMKDMLTQKENPIVSYHEFLNRLARRDEIVARVSKLPFESVLVEQISAVKQKKALKNNTKDEELMEKKTITAVSTTIEAGSNTKTTENKEEMHFINDKHPISLIREKNLISTTTNEAAHSTSGDSSTDSDDTY